MRERKILFDIVIADMFSDKGLSAPIGEYIPMQLPIDFDWDEQEDVMKPAERALKEYIESVYPNKQYRIYYWWWRDLPGWDNSLGINR